MLLSCDYFPLPETETNVAANPAASDMNFTLSCSQLVGVKLLLCRPSKSRRVKQNGSLLPGGDTATESMMLNKDYASAADVMGCH